MRLRLLPSENCWLYEAARMVGDERPREPAVLELVADDLGYVDFDVTPGIEYVLFREQGPPKRVMRAVRRLPRMGLPSAPTGLPSIGAQFTWAVTEVDEADLAPVITGVAPRGTAPDPDDPHIDISAEFDVHGLRFGGPGIGLSIWSIDYEFGLAPLTPADVTDTMFWSGDVNTAGSFEMRVTVHHDFGDLESDVFVFRTA